MHTCHCGKRVERDGLHGLSCTKSAGRFSRHATLNSLMKQTLVSLDLPSMLEPRGLFQTDGKSPDGVTMIPWEMGKQLVWDVLVVDALAPSRLNQGSLCNPGTTATEAEERKIEKYRELIDNGFIFQPVALEVREQDVSAKTFRQKKTRDVSVNFSSSRIILVLYYLGFVFGFLQNG